MEGQKVVPQEVADSEGFRRLQQVFLQTWKADSTKAARSWLRARYGTLPGEPKRDVHPQGRHPLQMLWELNSAPALQASRRANQKSAIRCPCLSGRASLRSGRCRAGTPAGNGCLQDSLPTIFNAALRAHTSGAGPARCETPCRRGTPCQATGGPPIAWQRAVARTGGLVLPFKERGR